MYQYQEIKPRVFAEENQTLFLAIRDRARKLLSAAGAIRLQELMSAFSGDTWTVLACVDRLVELGELREITQPGIFSQYRVFIDPNDTTYGGSCSCS